MSERHKEPYKFSENEFVSTKNSQQLWWVKIRSESEGSNNNFSWVETLKHSMLSVP